jgi:pyruvate ferredoxin oxidoreductase beta subunit
VRKIRRKVPVQDYLKLQRRFAHLFRGGHEDPRVARLQAVCDANIAEYGLIDTTAKDV